MPAINNRIFDAALAQYRDEATSLYLCSANPGTDWTLATSTYALASYSGVVIGSTEDAPGGGRRAPVQSFTGGASAGPGTATSSAVAPASNERAPVSGTVAAPGGVEGQAIALGAALWLTFPAPAP